VPEGGHFLQIDLPLEASTWTRDIPDMARANPSGYWDVNWTDAYDLFMWHQTNISVPNDLWLDVLLQAAELLGYSGISAKRETKEN
jgi:hypothetical protein